MKRFLDGDLQGLELPRDLPVLRAEAEEAIAQEQSLSALYLALSQTHPVALGELVVGPRALQGNSAAEAAFEVLEVLEGELSPKALYSRLAKLHPDSGAALAEAALSRFPQAQWAQALGERFEVTPGLKELDALRGSSNFEQACHRHAQIGHLDALIQMAIRGSLEPLAALIVAGQNEAALRAAALLLDHHPKADVIAWFAAASGPNCDHMICQLIPHLRSKTAVEALLNRAPAYPRAETLLRTLLPAVR